MRLFFPFYSFLRRAYLSLTNLKREKERIMMKKQLTTLLIAGAIALMPTAAFAEDAAPEVNPVDGPSKVTLDGGIGTLDLAEGLMYLNKKDGNALNKYYLEPVNENSIGTVFPADENKDWSILLSYEETGYISDKDGAKLDADAILDDYKKGTKEQNKVYEKAGEAPITITGWETAPTYDSTKHTLTWAIKAESDGQGLVNHETRILTRKGFIAATLISDPEHLVADKVEAAAVLEKLVVTGDQTYDKYDKSTDKAAAYGLAGLIAAGGVAALAKTGFLVILKKFFIVIIVAVIGFFGWLFRKFKSKKEQ
jgi:uncharacterized membrane-anchored protein